MRALLLACLCLFAIIIDSPGEEMDTAAIKQFVTQIDNSLPQGNIYRINYTVTDTRTQAFYDHANEIIKLLEDNHAEALRNIRTTHAPGEVADPAQDLLAMENSFKHQLKQCREYKCISDYSLDGIGFYLKQEMSFLSAKGEVGPHLATIYASDGKIMGTFTLNDNQAAIQPATERAQCPGDFWTDVAYLMIRNRISHFVGGMPSLTIAPTDSELVVQGDAPGIKKELTHLELRIDKTTLRPLEMSMVYYGSLGKLISRNIKTWQY